MYGLSPRFGEWEAYGLYDLHNMPSHAPCVGRVVCASHETNISTRRVLLYTQAANMISWRQIIWWYRIDCPHYIPYVYDMWKVPAARTRRIRRLAEFHKLISINNVAWIYQTDVCLVRTQSLMCSALCGYANIRVILPTLKRAVQSITWQRTSYHKYNFSVRIWECY